MGRRHAVVAAAGLTLCAWCGWVSGFHRSTAPALVTWSVSLGTVVAIDLLFWQGRRGRRPGVHLAPVARPWPRPEQPGGRAGWGISPWLGLVVVVVAWEVLAVDTGTTEPHLTISALTQAFRPLDAGVLLAWMLAGIGYGATRARSPVPTPSRAPRQDPRETPGRSVVALLHGPTVGPALLLPASRAAGVVFWLGLVGTGLIVEVAARGSRGRLATAEEFLRHATGPAAAKVLAVAAWMVAGYHLFGR